jgi:uncharacterized protein (TIGR02996 family)
MNDGDALMEAILAAPDDDLPRLVYADWLQENGQPERAEFIRVQIELSQLGTDELIPSNSRAVELAAREQTLLALYRDAWLAPIQAERALERHVSHGQFRRGFVEVVWMPARYYLRQAERLLNRTPVRELRVTGASNEDLAELLESPFLGRLDGLDLSYWKQTNTVTHLIFQTRNSASLSQLRLLRVRGCGINDFGARLLANVLFDWPLRELDVAFNPLGDEGLTVLRSRFGAAVRTGPAV